MRCDVMVNTDIGILPPSMRMTLYKDDTIEHGPHPAPLVFVPRIFGWVVGKTGSSKHPVSYKTARVRPFGPVCKCGAMGHSFRLASLFCEGMGGWELVAHSNTECTHSVIMSRFLSGNKKLQCSATLCSRESMQLRSYIL